MRSETRLRAQRSALRLFLHRASRDCAAIACWCWGRVATSTHSPPVRRRVNRGTSSLCAPAVFAPRFARLRGDSRAGKKITFPQKRKSQKEAPDTAWGRNTAPWVLSQQDKPSRMDTMAQFTLSHMVLIIVPCRGNGVNTTRNVAPRGIFCIFVSTFGQYVKTACKPLFSQRNISCRPSIFAAAIAALPLFYQRQHRTIPALRLKHRFDGCGTASALPKCSIMSGCGTRIVLRGQKPLALCDRCPCFGSLFPPLAALTFAASSIICAFGLASAAPRSPYRHLELCGIAQSKTAVPPLWERPPFQTIRCHAFSFIFAEQSLHSAQHIVLLFISANLLVDIIVQFFYCVSPLCIIHVDLFPWPRWF